MRRAAAEEMLAFERLEPLLQEVIASKVLGLSQTELRRQGRQWVIWRMRYEGYIAEHMEADQKEQLQELARESRQ